MTIQYLKKVSESLTHHRSESNVKDIVQQILSDIDIGGEAVALEYARKFDRYEGNIILTEEEIIHAADSVPAQIKEDIQFAHRNIRMFAEKQLACIQDMQFETSPGFVTGQKCIPLNSCGCYVPGGRYSHIASAIMTITTAKVAGCSEIMVCSPPRPGVGINPAIIYAAHLCGADSILALGGVQAIASMANGLFGMSTADIIVGPGNEYVAEAKRLLFGRVGIDMFAGPTESLVVADSSGDAELIAIDLVGQAEHGPTSPVWLVTDCLQLGQAVLERVPHLISALPEFSRVNAEVAWRDWGEVLVCSEGRQEMATIADRFAAEHVHVHAQDLSWWLETLTCYGSLFLGEETTVPYGDKAAGPNHCLPTSRAARYTGGLSVHKFVKIVTWQQTTRDASRDVALATARISRFEGMEGHARCADARLRKYFPHEEFVLAVEKTGNSSGSI
jgi:sulfopropanediol 3-dehydrogenase